MTILIVGNMIVITPWNQIMMILFCTQVNQHIFYRIAITSLWIPGVEIRGGPGARGYWKFWVAHLVPSLVALWPFTRVMIWIEDKGTSINKRVSDKWK